MKRTFDTLITVMAAHAGDATIDIPALHRKRNITQISTQDTRTQVNMQTIIELLWPTNTVTVSHLYQIKNGIYGISGNKSKKYKITN